MAHALGELIVGRSVKKCGAICRLICFHWAGGGTSHFIKWAADFSEDIEVLAVRPPGRETRLMEEPFTKVEDYAGAVADAVKAYYSDKPFAFFGHSLGARMCFATACHMKKKYNMEPLHMFVSGTFPPHYQPGYDALAKKNIPKPTDSDGVYMEYLNNIGGTPKDVLENKELLAFFLPPLKADLALLHSYRYKQEKPAVLTCPLTSVCGADDTPWVTMQEEWKHLTTGPYGCVKLNGGHFYLLEKINMDKLRLLVEREIQTTLETPL